MSDYERCFSDDTMTIAYASNQGFDELRIAEANPEPLHIIEVRRKVFDSLVTATSQMLNRDLLLSSPEGLYQEDLVTWITDRTEGLVPIITSSELERFKLETASEHPNRLSLSIGSILAAVDGTARTPKCEKLNDCVYRSPLVEKRGQQYREYYGLRADRFREFVSVLKSGEIKLPMIGDKTIDFLDDYAGAMYLTSKPAIAEG